MADTFRRKPRVQLWHEWATFPEQTREAAANGMTDDDLLARIATELDAAMRVSSLTTQISLHYASGVNERTISRILRARDCRVTTLGTLATALGLEVQVTFTRKP